MQIYDPKLHASEIRELEKNRRFLLAQRFGTKFGLAEPFAEPKHRGITEWEELTCVGYHPETHQLHAVVEIRRSTGYSGGLCSDGSTEYVRFFVDWHDGEGFQNVGLSTFRAFDVPSDEPRQHLVRLKLDEGDRAEHCNEEVLPTVRAVLSWNEIPDAEDEGELPIYGNRLEAAIQIAPRPFEWILDDDILAAAQEGGWVDPKALKEMPTWSSLVAEYRKQKVEDERLTYPVLAPLLDGKAAGATFAGNSPADLSQLNDLDIDLDYQSILETLAFGDPGNTQYEELVCVGLDSRRDTLGAVIHVKRPAGYLGNLCQRGSTEFVRFWADWDGAGDDWQNLGVATVPVHDLSEIPGAGVYFAVSLPIDPSRFLRPCRDPQVIRIRAVLSWERVPNDPEEPEPWGNLLDAWVRLRPASATEESLSGRLFTIGGVAIEDISPETFFAYPSPGIVDPDRCRLPEHDRSFAGLVNVAGRIVDRTGDDGPVFYQVQQRRRGVGGQMGPWRPAAHEVTWQLRRGLQPVQKVRANAPDGWFEYQQVDDFLVVNDHLAGWTTSGLPDGIYQVRLAYAKGHPDQGGRVVATDPVTVRLNNTGFRISDNEGGEELDLASDLDLVVEGAGDCRPFEQGEEVRGRLRAVHPHFGRWTLTLLPRQNGVATAPSCRAYRAVNDEGDGNLAWTLDTSDLPPCGYSLRLTAHDRAIVDSATNDRNNRHQASRYVGLVVA